MLSTDIGLTEMKLFLFQFDIFDDHDWIFTDNVKQMIKVYNRFNVNMENRDRHKSKIEENGKIEDITTHVIPNRDPLFSVLTLT